MKMLAKYKLHLIAFIAMVTIGYNIAPNYGVNKTQYYTLLQQNAENSKILEEKELELKKLNKDIKSSNSKVYFLNKDIKRLGGTLTTDIEESPSEIIDSSENNITTTGSASKVHFIDTGNSDAILIQGAKNVLIDGGDNNDESMLVEYLKKQGIKKLDYMIATHPHADHIGGLDAVINALPVENLLVANGSADTKTYKDFINAAANKGLNPSVPLEGGKFELGDGAYMQVYNTNGGSNTNEQSLITLYVNGKDKAIFTGDAETEAENEVLDKLPDVDLLKVGHHGSKSSTTESFLNKVNPEIAVITCGANNKYGHPHKETMSKLQSKGITIHRTDECGTIVCDSTGNGIKTRCKLGSFNTGK